MMYGPGLLVLLAPLVASGPLCSLTPAAALLAAVLLALFPIYGGTP